MKVLNFFNLSVVIGMTLFTWNVVLAEPMPVHVLQNVTPKEAQEINHALIHLGYKPTEKTLFSESSNAIIITKALKNEREPASLTIELVHLENDKDIPRTVFQYRLSGNDVTTMLRAFPRPEAFSEPSMPVASTDSSP